MHERPMFGVVQSQPSELLTKLVALMQRHAQRLPSTGQGVALYQLWVDTAAVGRLLRSGSCKHCQRRPQPFAASARCTTTCLQLHCDRFIEAMWSLLCVTVPSHNITPIILRLDTSQPPTCMGRCTTWLSRRGSHLLQPGVHDGLLHPGALGVQL